MLRSMFAGVTGLRSHQTMMEVVGNNIANVNTTGFKASRVAFQDTLSQLVKGGSAGGGPGTDTGGMNAQQIGLGVRVGAIDAVTTQGSLQATGRTTDLALQGDGYFIVKNAEQTLYTRAGNFNFDNQGNLVDTAGYIVQGFLADADGRINTTGPAQNLMLPLGQSVAPQATQNVTLGGNLSANAKQGDQVLSTIQVHDALGDAHLVTFEYTKGATAAGETTWNLRAYVGVFQADGKTPALDGDGNQEKKYIAIGNPAHVPTPEGAPTNDDYGVAITFDTSGNRKAGDNADFVMDGATQTDEIRVALPGVTATAGQTFKVSLGAPASPTSVHQYGGPTSAEAYFQDGSPTGYLRSFSVGDDGIFTGIYSNGLQKPLGQIAVASFSNPGSSNAGGLVKMGNNHLRADSNTGTPAVGVPGQLGNGSLAAGMLEMSNVDLAQEFTNLIIAQRGFQANSRVISTGDELLQEVVNIKR